VDRPGYASDVSEPWRKSAAGLLALIRDREVSSREVVQAAANGAGAGSLHGVPFTVKESIDPAGTPATQGGPALAGALAPADAPAVATGMSPLAVRARTCSRSGAAAICLHPPRRK
jgi:Asp-tRNA(Asn)/Glu-tRNA(Gln) amidotransferase A subunit family amidase